MSLSDNEIIHRVRSGETRQYARLVDRYKDKAFTLGMRMLKNRQDAEEAAQDAFVRAFKSLDKFEGVAKFGTWFYRILYNVCLTKLGKRKSDLLWDEYDDGSTYEQRPDSSPLQDLEAKDMKRFLTKIIESLPDKYRVILTLYYMQELSHQEISEITGVPQATVKVHLFRARGLLQKRCGEELAMETL